MDGDCSAVWSDTAYFDSKGGLNNFIKPQSKS